MKYILKLPTGASYDYSLEEIREEYKQGKLSDDCTVRRSDSQQWQTLRKLLEGLGDVSPLTPEQVAQTAAVGGTGVSQSAATRYKDAYTVASAVDGIGSVIKICGIIFGLLFLVAGVGLGSDSHNDILLYGGIAFAIIAGVPIYVLGVLVSASGQQTKASLDSAVHTSPFLTDPQKASVMSLRPAQGNGAVGRDPEDA